MSECQYSNLGKVKKRWRARSNKSFRESGLLEEAYCFPKLGWAAIFGYGYRQPRLKWLLVHVIYCFESCLKFRFLRTQNFAMFHVFCSWSNVKVNTISEWFAYALNTFVWNIKLCVDLNNFPQARVNFIVKFTNKTEKKIEFMFDIFGNWWFSQWWCADCKSKSFVFCPRERCA